MRVETATRRLDRRRHREDPEERSPEQLQQLERHHPFVSAKQDPGKHHPANFRGSRSATEKRASGFSKRKRIHRLKNIIEQCRECQRQLYIDFVDFEKAFDGVHRDRLWRVFMAYAIPQQIVHFVQSFSDNFTWGTASPILKSRPVSGKGVQCRRSFQHRYRLGDAANNRGPTTWHQMDPLVNA